jgi:hypothetical protein
MEIHPVTQLQKDFIMTAVIRVDFIPPKKPDLSELEKEI